MSTYESYRAQSFLVVDPDARIRDPDDIWTYLVYGAGEDLPSGASEGDYKLIPKGTEVRVSDVRIEPAGSSVRYFAHATSLDGATNFGWTSTTNFDGKFRNVTLGLIEPKPGAGRYAETAAWSAGDYIGQVSLVSIVDNRLELEKLTADMVEPYFEMVRDAAAEGVDITINSGFRTYGQQKYLYDNYIKGVPGFFLAARPGRSKHQNGTALDIPVGGGPGLPVYDWLAANATSYGYVRTVKSEYWHWEYLPAAAKKARDRGSHTTWN